MTLTVFFYSLAGAVIGSFLNVCSLRIPQGKDFVSGRSHCPACGHVLRAWDLIPLLSWIVLRGKCRYCKVPVSLRYPAAELLTALVFALACIRKGPGIEAVLLCLFFSLLITGALIDLTHYYIPDRISLLILLTGILRFLFCTRKTPAEFLICIAGLTACGGCLWLLRLITRGGIGLGDVKLMGAGGFFLGFPTAFFSMGAAYTAACIFCIPLIISGRIQRKTKIPMIPFFAASLITAALWGNEIIWWYLSLWT